MVKESIETFASKWKELVTSIENPQCLLTIRGQRFAAFLDELEANAMLPIAEHTFREKGFLEEIGEDERKQLEIRLSVYKAGWVVFWNKVDSLLKLLLDNELHPILLKGCDLALRYYINPSLRPMSDADIAFISMDDAFKAEQLLRNNGYIRESPFYLRDPWLFYHHLPPLIEPNTRFLVELHASLHYPPKDIRWKQSGYLLMENLDTYHYHNMTVAGLCPEADLVYLCGHMLLLHGNNIKAILMYDLKAIIMKTEIKWERVIQLGKACGLLHEVKAGLYLYDRVFSSNLRVVVFGKSSDAPSIRGTTFPLAVRKRVRTINLCVHSSGLLGPARFLRNLLFLPSSSLRLKYPKCRKWPIWVLTCCRILDVVGKTTKLMGTGLVRKLFHH